MYRDTCVCVQIIFRYTVCEKMDEVIAFSCMPGKFSYSYTNCNVVGKSKEEQQRTGIVIKQFLRLFLDKNLSEWMIEALDDQHHNEKPVGGLQHPIEVQLVQNAQTNQSIEHTKTKQKVGYSWFCSKKTHSGLVYRILILWQLEVRGQNMCISFEIYKICTSL